MKRKNNKKIIKKDSKTRLNFFKKISKKIKKNVNFFITNPLESIRKSYSYCRKYVMNNKYFCIFVFVNVINALLLRIFTIGGLNIAFAFSPFGLS